ncbi:MAG: Hsp20/alpha crystallin family protein [Candidatus Hydrothermarchaeaceae archaeon]
MRWDPYDEIRKIERRMNKIFEDFWSGGPKLLGSGKGDVILYEGALSGYREPFTDIIETEKEVVVTAEIPGVEKEDIKINTTEDRIKITAEARHEKREEKEGYVRRERGYESFYRVLALPAEVEAEKAKATYKNGILEVVLPKAKTARKTRIKVE